MDESYYYIPGYAYDLEIGANNQIVYLEIQKDTGEIFTYHAISTDSTGIDYYPDDSYTRNSFIAKIPEKFLPDGNYSIKTIIENGITKETAYVPGILNCTISNHVVVY